MGQFFDLAEDKPRICRLPVLAKGRMTILNSPCLAEY